MSIDVAITIFVLAILCGFAVISKVPATLHTPLMSGANSIHGIVLVGAMIIAVPANDPVSYLLSFIAFAFATLNVVGGYVVTDRMLQMFGASPRRPRPRRRRARRGPELIDLLVRFAWLAGAVAFVLGLIQMNSPATARNGNLLSRRRHGARRRRARPSVLFADRAPAGELASMRRLDHHPRRHRSSAAARPVHRAHREDDRDAPAGVAVQRGRRRRGGAHRDRRVPAARDASARPGQLEDNVATVLDIIIGSITFTGSLIASGKLMGLKITPSRPVRVPGGAARDAAAGAIIVVGG